MESLAVWQHNKTKNQKKKTHKINTITWKKGKKELKLKLITKQ